MILFWYHLSDFTGVYSNDKSWIERSCGLDEWPVGLVILGFFIAYARSFPFALVLGIAVPILRYALLCAYLVPIYAYFILIVFTPVSAQIVKMFPRMP